MYKRQEELLGKNPRQIHDIGVSMAFVPEDRLGMGLVGSMGMADNMMLKTYRSGRGPLLDRKPPRQLAERVKEELDVLTPSINTPVRRLSGGNVQKVLVGREIAQNPSVLMTAYAVRGLDINTSYTIYNLDVYKRQDPDGPCLGAGDAVPLGDAEQRLPVGLTLCHASFASFTKRVINCLLYTSVFDTSKFTCLPAADGS